MDPEMKLTLPRKLLLLSAISAASPVTAAPQYPEYSMVLIGGGLNTCSSQSLSSCAEKPQFPEHAKTEERYALSMAQIKKIVQPQRFKRKRQQL